jgi:polar amino acid transport system substrate-binding protein
MWRRRAFLSLVIPPALHACAVVGPAAPPADVRALLAPEGRLRIAVVAGAPGSMVRDAATGQVRGVAYELGVELARQLGVPHVLAEFAVFPDAARAVTSGAADISSFNMVSPLAAGVLLTRPLYSQESGYLARPGSSLQGAAEVDRPGVKVGVQQGSTSQGVLRRLMTQATIVPISSLQEVPRMLASGEIEVFATSKSILHDLADRAPGARVLAGHYTLEQQGLAIPKGREAALPWLDEFALQAIRSGLVARAAERARLRGISAQAA